ncbi:MAG: N-acetylmuramoyl-L-alanine amidase [Clostridia bacterium]
MRRWAALFLAVAILFSWAINVSAFTINYDGMTVDYPWDPIVLVVDGNTVVTEEMPPIIIDGRTLVPAREFFEQLGATVTWNNDFRCVIIELNGTQTVLTIDSKIVYINGNSTSIAPEDPAPKIVNNKTMIPVRFVSEEFGFKVEWLNETRTVKITSPDYVREDVTKVALSVEDNADCIFIAMNEFVNPNIFKMDNPKRLVIDIYDMNTTIKDGSIDESGNVVSRIRYSQHEDRFRVVADLNADINYEILKLKNGVEIYLTKNNSSVQEIPTEPETTPTEPTYPNLGGYVVVIDPGHGGTDPGAIYPIGSSNPSAREKDITLNIALKIKAILTNAGVKVVMTREGDTYPTLPERVELANSINADLYVSVHCNAMENKNEIDGAQVYYHSSSATGKKIASIVYEKIINYTGMTRRGIQDGSSLYVLKNTTMPAILTEGGFITNEKDRKYLNTELGRQAMANAIADGIMEALSLL